MRASAPGKLIVLGEHSVVYGHRAIAASVSRRTTVDLTASPGPTRLADSDIVDDRLLRALRATLPAEGWAVSIRTDLPVGRGMGSSASLSIALLRLRARFEGIEPDFAWLHAEGFALERIFHGDPSGIDHAVSALEGAVVYQRGEAPQPLAMTPMKVVVLDSGSAGNTAELVAGVAARRPGIEPALDRLGELVELAIGSLDDPLALGEAMDEAHALLVQIGVSTPILDDLVALARDHGATGAKLSGAGGGGVVMALCPDGGIELLRAAEARGIPAFLCTLPCGASED
ncbi:MAG: mevalonate kinase [Proteobacteria bacterium]|nr:mevalonate kinase [Pseudomonadota bacterium]MCP4918959.1 mevalonate kinase [Pseudomonadota bacterium]